MTDIKALFTDHKWIGGVFVAIPIFAMLSNNILTDSYGMRQIDSAIHDSLSSWKTAPTQSFNAAEGLSLFKGTGEPRMTIVEFADFLCPHCKSAYQTLDAYAHSRNDIRFIFKPFPLDGTCNKDVQRKGSGLTCRLTYLTFCADKLANKGWDAHHWIFDNQNNFSSSNLSFDKVVEDFSKELKMDQKQLDECVSSDEIAEKVMRMAAEGGAAKIPGTPTVFVNGKLLERGQFIPVLNAIYESLK